MATAWRTALAQSTLAASPTANTGSATAGIVTAANAFLGTLSDAQKQTGLFAWRDTAQKQRWSNFPSGAFAPA